MDELIKQVTAKAGISEDQARSAVNTVLDFVKLACRRQLPARSKTQCPAKAAASAVPSATWLRRPVDCWGRSAAP